MKNINRKIKKTYNFVLDRAKENLIEQPIKQAQALIFGINDFNPASREVLKKYGNEIITRIDIKRSPVPSLLTGVLDALSLGKFGKRQERADYDKLFHLYVVINGKVLIEKNEVINIQIFNGNRPKTETEPISTPIPQGLTINQLLQNCKKLMGNKFFTYSSVNNNCQDFIMSLLKASNLGAEQDFTFIKQNTEQLFSKMGYLKTIANATTNLGATANILTQGAGLEEEIKKHKPKRKSNKKEFKLD